MGSQRCQPRKTWFSVWTLLLWTFTFSSYALAQKTRWIPFTTDSGTVYLDDNRRPALYTGDFGDCEGDSLINVTRFDASMYRDNLTVMFHMAGNTALQNEHVMMYFSVFAYGENRFSLTFNPCVINIPTLCPLNSSKPIEANGLIPIGPADVAGIPEIAFTIPDFEGQAILRLFSNTTQSQIACYSAVMRNGNSFSHPNAVGSVLGIFAAIALISSVAVAIYGQLVPETRTHYAHSVSVFVVFSVFQHIFFSGSLSMNWPSVLVAFWSNYAWSAGMIYSRKMQNSINQFIGSNRGNISMVGSAPSNHNDVNLGGGFALSQIYKRDVEPSPFSALQSRSTEHMLRRRYIVNSTSGFTWYGNPVAPGLPLPGNYSGFAGTLAQLDIPASNAFLTGLLWLLILIAGVAVAAILTKVIVEILVRSKLVKSTNMNFFRSNWIHFTGAAVLRTCFIAFFMMVYLALFQFVLGGGVGAIAIAALVFVIFLIGLFGASTYAIWYRIRLQKSRNHSTELSASMSNGSLPDDDKIEKETNVPSTAAPPASKKTRWWHSTLSETQGELHVHDDETYMTRFGWLSSRFRRSKWWFFSAWLVYELIRACFYGGAAGHPLVQVFGLLAWEIIAFVAIVIMKPFESNRLNLIMVYFLGFSKVATVALSCAFDPRFKLSRILTTVIGVVIIVIQGILTICLMVAIVMGAISSYMSITRNSEDFKPVSWTNLRIRYFDHIEHKATDRPRPPPPPPPPEPEKPKEPYFEVSTVRREPKIEDEDAEDNTPDEPNEVQDEDTAGDDEIHSVRNSHQNPYMSRMNSVRSRTSASNLPYGARAHRRSWSVKDLTSQSIEHIPSGLHSRMSVESVRDVPMRYRAASMRDVSGNFEVPNERDERPTRTFVRTRSSSNPLEKHSKFTAE